MRVDGNFIIQQEQPKIVLKFNQVGRYLVVDFGEATGNEMEVEITGANRVVRSYITDVIN